LGGRALKPGDHLTIGKDLEKAHVYALINLGAALPAPPENKEG